MSDVKKEMRRFQQRLIQGVRRSGQSSYQRRAPNSGSIEHLAILEHDLKAFLRNHSKEADGWRMLSQVQEVMLKYRLALENLEKACSLSTTTKRDRKRFSRLRENTRTSLKSGISYKHRSGLIRHLEDIFSKGETSDDISLTHSWLMKERGAADDIIDIFFSEGIMTDADILEHLRTT